MLDALGVTSSVIVPLVARARTVGALAFGTTSTSRRLMKEDLELAEELARRAAIAIDNARLYEQAQSAAKLREELVAVVAHDLKNPLSVIQGAANLVLEDLPSGPESNLTRQQIDMIRRAAERMHRLVRDLLDISALQAGKLVMRRRPVRVNALLDDALEAIEPLARAKSIQVAVTPIAQQLHVLADRDRVLQVFSNLCGNAVKFTPPGGQVRLTAHAAAQPNRVVFSVSDTGPGIAPEDQPRVFDRFWQSSTRTHGGSGLGLTIAKGIVEAHGGHIWLESAPGAGTTFFFTLPSVPSSITTERRQKAARA